MKTLSTIILLQVAPLFGHAFQIGNLQPSGARVASVAPTSSSIKNDVASDRRRGLSYLRMAKETSNQTFETDYYERRSFLQNVAQSIVLSSPVLASSSIPASAEDLPQITHKVYMDVRISRADGTFYVKDAPSADADEPFYGQLVLGLFGNQTPNHVQNFLKYVDVPYDVDSPLPSYSRSKFQTLDASTGLLIGGTVSKIIEMTEIVVFDMNMS